LINVLLFIFLKESIIHIKSCEKIKDGSEKKMRVQNIILLKLYHILDN